MTLEIRIITNNPMEYGPLRGQVDEAMEALGFSRAIVVNIDKGDGTTTEKTFVVNDAPSEQAAGGAPADVAAADAPKRERGKPAPGRARRTKEEIAEDEAADKADAAGSSAFGISTGGDRVNPEEAAQDAADEAAEDAANRDAAKPLTLDDVKNAVGLYVTKFGAGDFEKGRQIASEDGPGLFVDVLGQPPAGEPFWKFSILPTDQDKIAAMVKAWTDAANSGTRYQRKGA